MFSYKNRQQVFELLLNSGEPVHPIFVKNHLVDPIELEECPLIEIAVHHAEIPAPFNFPKSFEVEEVPKLLIGEHLHPLG